MEYRVFITSQTTSILLRFLQNNFLSFLTGKGAIPPNTQSNTQQNLIKEQHQKSSSVTRLGSQQGISYGE